MSELKDLERRARTEPSAAMDMAERLMLGIDMKPDQKAAYRMVQQAARLGHGTGGGPGLPHAAGIGRKADPEGAQKMLSELAQEDRFAALQLAFSST